MDIYFKKTEKSVSPKTYLMENPLAKKRIRLATPDDFPVIRSIYAPYITDTTVTFEYDVPSEEEFTQRLAAIARTYPILVIEADGVVVGYAYAAAFKSRTAYQWAAETVIYLRRDCNGLGLGQPLYQSLIEVLKLQGICQGIGVITAENINSIKFHRRLGFKLVAQLERVGYKFGKWLDVYWMQKQLASLPDQPEAIRIIAEISETDGFISLLSKINDRLNY